MNRLLACALLSTLAACGDDAPLQGAELSLSVAADGDLVVGFARDFAQTWVARVSSEGAVRFSQKLYDGRDTVLGAFGFQERTLAFSNYNGDLVAFDLDASGAVTTKTTAPEACRGLVANAVGTMVRIADVRAESQTICDYDVPTGAFSPSVWPDPRRVQRVLSDGSTASLSENGQRLVVRAPDGGPRFDGSITSDGVSFVDGGRGRVLAQGGDKIYVVDERGALGVRAQLELPPNLVAWDGVADGRIVLLSADGYYLDLDAENHGRRIDVTPLLGGGARLLDVRVVASGTVVLVQNPANRLVLHSFDEVGTLRGTTNEL